MACRFLDGPAAGQTLMLRRAPIYLRVTTSDVANFDALDQLDDEWADGEDVWAYRAVSGVSSIHVRPGGCYQMRDYGYIDDQPPPEVLRDNESWRSWVDAHAEAQPPPQFSPAPS